MVVGLRFNVDGCRFRKISLFSSFFPTKGECLPIDMKTKECEKKNRLYSLLRIRKTELMFKEATATHFLFGL